MSDLRIVVTGGAGFIGSAYIRYLINKKKSFILNIDKLTYAGNLESLEGVEGNKRYKFSRTDICDFNKISEAIKEFRPNFIVHFAAESHVDRSIDSPGSFIETNVIGTYNLLEVSRNYYDSLEPNEKKKFRFHHISTDEVYGDLNENDPPFSEKNSYMPSSPYSASKASSDHLVRAWHRTFNLPILISNCSNNYGPYQFPEKLIPLMVSNALQGKKLPIYGNGLQVRDWLYVDDHVEALFEVVLNGKIGHTYNIGGNNEITNIDVVKSICQYLDEVLPVDSSYVNLIHYVEDRAGHDKRYAIDASKISNELNWSPKESFQSGLKKTIKWYLDNQTWVDRVKDGSNQGERLGLIKK